MYDDSVIDEAFEAMGYGADDGYNDDVMGYGDDDAFMGEEGDGMYTMEGERETEFGMGQGYIVEGPTFADRARLDTARMERSTTLEDGPYMLRLRIEAEQTDDDKWVSWKSFLHAGFRILDPAQTTLTLDIQRHVMTGLDAWYEYVGRTKYLSWIGIWLGLMCHATSRERVWILWKPFADRYQFYEADLIRYVLMTDQDPRKPRFGPKVNV